MNALKRLLTSLKGKPKNILPSPPEPDTQLHINAYAELDAVEMTMKGGEVKIGGALIGLMLKYPLLYKIVKNSVEATEREMQRQWLETELERLAKLN